MHPARLDLLTLRVEGITEVMVGKLYLHSVGLLVAERIAGECLILEVNVLVFRFLWQCRATPHVISLLCLRARLCGS